MVKKLILTGVVFTLFVGGVIYSVIYFLPAKRQSGITQNNYLNQNTAAQGEKVEELSPAPEPLTTGLAKTTIRDSDEAEAENYKVVYRDSKFSPASLILKSESDGGSCVVAVINDSKTPLTIRLSPHTEKDNWGSQYKPIPPRESLIFDPRFRIPKLAFHNHLNPSEEFSVTLGEGCSEF